MNVTVYGDFNSLLSYLASQRADWLVRTATAEIDWRAVEHCRQMPVTGIRSDPGDSGWQREGGTVTPDGGPLTTTGYRSSRLPLKARALQGPRPFREAIMAGDESLRAVRGSR